jgi:hypothetical protein
MMTMNRRMFLVASTVFTTLTSLIRPVAKADPGVVVTEAQANLLWGTYGKSGKEPLKWVRLIDCETDHLQAILRTQPHIYDAHIEATSRLEAIKAILTSRGAAIPQYDGGKWLRGQC